MFSHTTAPLDAGDTETVVFNFTGDNSVDYILKFDDGGANHTSAAIDNLSFNQYGRVIPEPSTFMLTGVGIAMLLRRRRTRSANGGR